MTNSITNLRTQPIIRRARSTWMVFAVGFFLVTSAFATFAFGQQLQESAQDFRADVVSAEFPYESKYVETLGSKMHYVDQGEGDVFLFLHGKPTILVTGATGKTGAPVVRQLLERGYHVRAFVHKTDDRSKRLAELGAEVVVGDIHDLESVRSAMRGAKRVYFCYLPFDGLLRAATNVAIAARDEGVEAVVNMSASTTS